MSPTDITERPLNSQFYGYLLDGDKLSYEYVCQGAEEVTSVILQYLGMYFIRYLKN